MAENAYEIARRQFDKAVRYVNIKTGIAEYLRTPKRELIVNFPPVSFIASIAFNIRFMNTC